MERTYTVGENTSLWKTEAHGAQLVVSFLISKLYLKEQWKIRSEHLRPYLESPNTELVLWNFHYWLKEASEMTEVIIANMF